MALFHQIRRADENDKLCKAQEKSVKAYAKSVSSIKSFVPNEGVQPKNRPGRKPSVSAKISLTLRLDPDVIEHFKATGEGWQTRMNEALRKAANL